MIYAWGWNVITITLTKDYVQINDDVDIEIVGYKKYDCGCMNNNFNNKVSKWSPLLRQMIYKN